MLSLIKPPAIIPYVRGAGNIALSKKLWVALYLNWKMNNSTENLEEVARMFIRTYPKRLHVIEHTAKHFVIVQGIYYGYMTTEYNLALFNILEHANQHGMTEDEIEEIYRPPFVYNESNQDIEL